MHSLATFHRVVRKSEHTRTHTHNHKHKVANRCNTKLQNVLNETNGWLQIITERIKVCLKCASLTIYEIVRGIFLFCAGRKQLFLLTISVGKALIPFPIAAFFYFTCSLNLLLMLYKRSSLVRLIERGVFCGSSGIHVSITTHCDVTARLWLLQEMGRHET
jgi:hypothetical protein